MDRVVLHVDMDAFYAAVEERDDPRLRGRPVVIGADPRGGRGRGVACTANYAARAFGIRSATPISTAWRLCPHAVFIRPDFRRYKQASHDVMAVLARYADVLQVVGLDEAYLDVTQAVKGRWDRVPSFARSLQAAVRRATGLSCSVGAAACKQVAKVASDWRKPHGVTVVAPQRMQAFLDPLPVGKLHGCGPKTSERLHALGLRTVEDLRNAPTGALEDALGSHGTWLREVAHGRDLRPVEPERAPRKSRGNESTFGMDEGDMQAVHARAHALLAELLDDASADGRPFATVTAKVRYRGFETVTRAATAPAPLDARDVGARQVAGAMVGALLGPLLEQGRPVRLVGVRLSGFEDGPGQRSLATYGVGTSWRRPVRRPALRCRQSSSQGTLLPVGHGAWRCVANAS